MTDAATMHGIEFEIRGDTSRAVASVERLTATLGKLKQATIAASSIRALTSEMKALGRAKVTPTIDAAKASGGLRKIQTEIEKTSAALEKYKNKIAEVATWKNKITSAKNSGLFSGDITGALASGDEKIRELRETVAIYEDSMSRLKEAQANALSGMYPAADIAEPLRQMTDAAGEGTASFRQLGTEVRRSANKFSALRDSANSVTVSLKGGLKTVLRYAFGIRSMFMLANRIRSALTDGLATLSNYDTRTSESISSLKNALGSLKGALASAFAPILDVAAPILTRFIGWLTDATNAVGRFFALLTGEDHYYKAVYTSANSAAGAIGDVGGAAKEAMRYLAPFDELNVLSDSGSSGGGGGSGSGAGSALSYVKEALDNTGVMSQLALTVDSVLFDWKDLTAEDITAKAIAGLSTLGGGILGGVPGVIIGGLAGLSLGIGADSVIFDFNGRFDANELLTTIVGGINGLGLVGIGAAIGGVPGAAIGLILDVGVMAKISEIKPDWNGNTKEQIKAAASAVTEHYQREIEQNTSVWSWLGDELDREFSHSKFYETVFDESMLPDDKPVIDAVTGSATANINLLRGDTVPYTGDDTGLFGSLVGKFVNWFEGRHKLKLDASITSITDNVSSINKKKSLISGLVGKVEGFTDNIPATQKTMDDFSGLITTPIDRIPGKKKILDGITAKFSSASDSLTTVQKTGSFHS